MINLAVINLKSVCKTMVKIISIILVIAMVLKFINIIRSKKYVEKITQGIGASHTEVIDESFSLSHYMNQDHQEKTSKFQKILISEFAAFSSEESLMEKENQEEAVEFENVENSNETEIPTSIQNDNSEIDDHELEILENETTKKLEDLPLVATTKVIQEKNKIDKFTNTYGSVKIKNESKYELTEEMLTPNIDFINKHDIIIFHTHTCESYTQTAENTYEPSGNYRTTDLTKSVARVGSELTNYLTNEGYHVYHDTTYHDYPAYTGSYGRSLQTVTNILKNKTNAELIIDLHRDALGNNSDYGPCVQIGDERVAQVMFVMGTDGGGLDHPNWLNNLKLAIKIQEKANQMYPGLFKPIILRNSRYNQHVTGGACIIEVGATGNTLEECNGSMKYLANVISEVMK